MKLYNTKGPWYGYSTAGGRIGPISWQGVVHSLAGTIVFLLALHAHKWVSALPAGINAPLLIKIAYLLFAIVWVALFIMKTSFKHPNFDFPPPKRDLEG